MSPALAPRERIVEAATRLGREGQPLNMKVLAAGAGLSRASVYRHLGGRKVVEALLTAQGLARETTPRERLLDEAMALIAAHGPVGFSLETLAVQARVSPSTVYREFGDRDGLVREVIRQVGPPVALTRLLEDLDAPLEDVLSQFTEAMFTRLVSQPFMLSLLLQKTPAHLRELRRLRRAEESVSAAVRRYLSAQIERGRLAPAPVDVLTHALIGQVLSLVVTTRIGGDLASSAALTDRARALVQLFLRGARRGPRSRSR